MRKSIALTAIAAASGAALAGPTVLGRDVSADPGIYLSRSSSAAGTFVDANGANWGVGGDMFGVASRSNGGPNGLPFAIADDSASIFTADTQGFIAENDLNDFFGVVDTNNSINGGNMVTATWSFDVSGFSGLSFAADFAAMGDFEAANDVYLFEYQIDGSGWTTLLASSINEDGSAIYTMDNGAPVALDDPMLMGGVQLSEDFQTVSAAIAGTGSTLDIRFSATADGGAEAFAFRNLLITGVPTPGTLALLGFSGALAARRRRA